MAKKFYVFAWFLLISMTLASVVSGRFDAVSMLVVSTGVAALVYAFALWAVTTSPGGEPTK